MVCDRHYNTLAIRMQMLLHSCHTQLTLYITMHGILCFRATVASCNHHCIWTTSCSLVNVITIICSEDRPGRNSEKMLGMIRMQCMQFSPASSHMPIIRQQFSHVCQLPLGLASCSSQQQMCHLVCSNASLRLLTEQHDWIITG